MKKYLLLLSSLTSVLPSQEINPEEVAALDSFTIIQEPISQDVMQLPPPKFESSRKNTALAVSLSVLYPGLGHTYLGDWKTAGSLMGTTTAFLGFTVAGRKNRNITVPMVNCIVTDWSYGLYASYRDARNHNGQANYSYRMPTEDFVDLAFASFNPKVLKKPEVWGGYLGSLALVIGLSYLTSSKEPASSATFSHGPKHHYYPPYAFQVGISEEALFRGYLQSQISEITNPTAGIVVSSLLFGAAHIPNAYDMSHEGRRQYYTVYLPFLTGIGAYFGWMAYKNHSLKECVALHSWYDFTFFALNYFAAKASIAPPGPSGFSMNFDF